MLFLFSLDMEEQGYYLK